MGADRAAKRIRQAIPDPEGFVLKSKTGADVLDNAPLTAGEKYEIPELLSLEKAIINSSEDLTFQNQSRFDTINKVVRSEMEDIIPDRELRPEEATAYLDNLLDERIRIAGVRADEALSGVSTTRGRGDANLAARDALEGAYTDALKQEKVFWSQVPETAPVTPDNAITVLKDRLTGVLDNRVAKALQDVPQVVKTFLGRVNKKGEFIGGKLSKGGTLKELQSLRSEMLREIRAERAKDAPDRSKISLLNDIQESLLSDMDIPGGDSIKLALDFSKSVNTKFRQGGGAGCPKPTTGYPVAVVQHALGGDRTQALAMADSFADACFIVAAIDAPLHGLGSTSPLFAGPIERTFNVDLINNTTGAVVKDAQGNYIGDGKTDPSGAHYINADYPVTTRDNGREAAADLIVFAKTVANLDIDGGGPDVDPGQIHFVGLSLGALMGSVASHHAGFRTSTLAAPAGVLTKAFFESPSLSPRVVPGLEAKGLVKNSTLWNNLTIRDFQTILDTMDPINHIAASRARQPVLLFQMDGDDVLPNSSQQRLVVAGNLRKISAAGPNPVGATEGVWVEFTEGSHGSLFSSAASLAATVELQSQTVQFAASAVAPGGPFVVITNTSIIGK